MSIKTNGAEFKRFYDDPDYWPNGRWHEDTDVTVDGVHEEDLIDSLSTIEDTAVVTFSCGCVMDEDNNEVDGFVDLFKKWRKAQGTESVVVEIPKGRKAELAAAIKAIGGKVAA